MSTAARLSAYLESIDGSQPFDWRTNNCSHLAAGWWLAATGIKALQGLAMPCGPTTAPRWLARHGGCFADLVARQLKRARIAPQLAQAGDLVIVADGLCSLGGVGGALGVCTGRLAVLLGADGRLVRGPMSAALHAYPLDEARA